MKHARSLNRVLPVFGSRLFTDEKFVSDVYDIVRIKILIEYPEFVFFFVVDVFFNDIGIFPRTKSKFSGIVEYHARPLVHFGGIVHAVRSAYAVRPVF
ncbi:MAG: hypothetical protein ACRC77_04575, partial [Bacteroidales bacterium]